MSMINIWCISSEMPSDEFHMPNDNTGDKPGINPLHCATWNQIFVGIWCQQTTICQLPDTPIFKNHNSVICGCLHFRQNVPEMFRLFTLWPMNVKCDTYHGKQSVVVNFDTILYVKWQSAQAVLRYLLSTNRNNTYNSMYDLLRFCKEGAHNSFFKHANHLNYTHKLIMPIDSHWFPSFQPQV